MRVSGYEPRGSAMVTSLRTKLRELFGVDLRSLALLRIGLGTSVFADTCVRAFDLVGLYTDRGVFPRELVLATQGPGIYLSAHYWASVHPLLEGALFVLAGVAALALMVGWRTRSATILCWYLVASIQLRQPLVYIGGDSILRMLLFWGMFLPLAARFSLDASRGDVNRGPDRFVSGATIALLLQVCLIYWMTGLRKDGPLWWTGQAVFYTLHQEAWVTQFGESLRDYPAVLETLTYATLGLELFGPFLAFLPIYTSTFRFVTVIIFAAFHIGLALMLNIGLFPLFSIVAWLPFIPTEFWRRAGWPDNSIPAAASDWRTRLSSAAALMCLVYVVALLAQRARVIPRVLPPPVVAAGTALRLQQTWNMFAPDPPTSTVRHDVHKTLIDGSHGTERAGDSFRWTVYLAYAGVPRSAGDPYMRSIHRYAIWHCTLVDQVAAQRVAIIMTTREINAHGVGEPDVRVLADVSCTVGTGGHPWT